jgi:hypothetical protein
MSNQLERAEQHLNQLMPLIQTTPSLVGELFVIRVMIAAYRYDMPAVIESAQQALSLVLPEEASPSSKILLSLSVVNFDTGRKMRAAQMLYGDEVGGAIVPAEEGDFITELA